MPVYFSHTDRTLQEHLFGLKEVIDQVLPQKHQKYWEKEELKQLLYLLIAYHDVAKATPYFQYRIARATKEENPKYFKEHRREFESWLNHEAISDLSEGEIREMSRHTLFGATVSQQQFVNEDLQFIQLTIYEVIRRHHGDLMNFNSYLFTKAFLDEQDKINFKEQFKSIDFSIYSKVVKDLIQFLDPEFDTLKKRHGRQRKFNRFLENIANQKTVNHYLKIQFIYSLLLSADKGDVMLPDKQKILRRFVIPANIIDHFKKTIPSGKAIDKTREDAYQTVFKNLEANLHQNFFSITLPTGLGKTFTAYKVALRLKEENLNHRIIYCLPFTSIIDQNGRLLKKILDQTGQSENLATLHHYLSAPQEKMKHSAEEDMTFQEGEYLTEGWENEIIITTFVQLFESLFTNRNRGLRKFHNLANSIIILDEVQNIPPKFVEVIERVFEEMANKFNTIFLFVTATQPIILPNKIVQLEVNKNKPSGYFFKGLNRISIDQHLLKSGELNDEQLFEELENCASDNPNESILVIVNTKIFSQSIYERLNKTITHKCLYLSAALIPYHRKKVIDAVKNADKPICLISTQVVEAGVDIDFDIVFREYAPMDSINQAAGRCNRNGAKNKGILYIFKYKRKVPLKIYDATLINITKDVLEERENVIPESRLFEINLDYFNQVKQKIQDNNDNSIKLLEHIYSLQFEKIKDEFKLIEKNWIEHDFFIPVNQEAEEVWLSYLDCNEIKNSYERKAELKRIKPCLLNYVISIPDYIVEVEDNESELSIIRRDVWSDFYSNEIGYFKTQNKTISF